MNENNRISYNSIIKNKFLAASLVCWVIVGILSVVLQKNEGGASTNFYSSVQSKIRAITKAGEEKATVIIKTFDDDNLKKLINLQPSVDYPFFILQKDSLRYWSDPQFIPDYKETETKKWKYLSNSRGIFIVYYQAFTQKNKEYRLQIHIPLEIHYKVENKYLKAHFNKEIFEDQKINISSNPLSKTNDIYNSDANFLFSVNLIKSTNNKNSYLNYIAFIIIILGSVFFGIALQQLLKKHAHPYRREVIIISWMFFLGISTALILSTNFPLNYILHSPEQVSLKFLFSYFISSVLLIIFTVVVLLNYPYLKVYHFFTKSPLLRYVYVLFLFIKLWIWLQIYIYFINLLWSIPSIGWDISRNLSFDASKLILLCIFLFLSIAYFLIQQILLRLIISQISKDYLKLFNGLFLSACTYLAFGFVFGFLNIYVFLIHLIYCLIVLIGRFPKYIYQFKYLRFIYFFLASAFCASVASIQIYENTVRKEISEKRRYSTQLITDNDLEVENELSVILNNIIEDKVIINSLVDPLADKTIVFNKLKKTYLNFKFDKYQIDVDLYDKDGISLLNPEEENYFDLEKRYKHIWYETDKSNIYFINDLNTGLKKEYYGFQTFDLEKKNKVYIIIHLKQENLVPDNVYKELLSDKKFEQDPESKKFNYALYSNKKLIYSKGSFNYEKDFDLKLFKNSQITIKGIVVQGFHHILVESGSKKKIIISSLQYSTEDVFMNFSFLFLLLCFAAVNISILQGIFQKQRYQKISFTLRIQIYLNLVFFLPLFITSIAILNIISENFKHDYYQTAVLKIQKITQLILPYVENYRKEMNGVEKLEIQLNKMNQNLDSEINIFDLNGYLISTTQKRMFDKNPILIPFINLFPFYAITKEYRKDIVVDEQIGDLQYKSIYTPIRQVESGKIIGIVQTPFFEAAYELTQKQLDVIKIILNVFTSLLILFLVLLYFVSNLLTEPFKIIIQKLRRTTFSERNEALVWKSQDEIGLLVNAYNKMLLNLDEGRISQAQNQKELAWREMAKQVAHEIKNPLTPMRLTLQHLQMRLERQEDEFRKMFEPSFETLLTQIDTLNSIATSFSSFARMPIPKSEKFDLSAVLNETIELYPNTPKSRYDFEIQPGVFNVMGDRQLMGQIFTNLILNAQQAVEDEKMIHVKIKMTRKEKLVEIKIQDNGQGIDPEIKDKIFLPNFTTKMEGSGIGLALAKRGIEHAGGKIWFETKLDEGTTFFIEIPLFEN